jgi:hypothetical protein
LKRDLGIERVRDGNEKNRLDAEIRFRRRKTIQVVDDPSLEIVDSRAGYKVPYFCFERFQHGRSDYLIPLAVLKMDIHDGLR